MPSGLEPAYGDQGQDEIQERDLMFAQRNDEYNVPDAHPSLYELGPDDFPRHFSERDGRLFHANINSLYPLPADTPEQERMNVQHAILYQLIGANYVGPVPEVLIEEAGRRKLVLDLCTGTGKWVMDMAREFPHVLFRAFDIVPIATRYPPSNGQFEIHDVNGQYRWADNTFDFVHARSVTMAVQDYSTVLQEVARVMRSGGLFLSCEWGRAAAFDPGITNMTPSLDAPASTHFFEVLGIALRDSRRIEPIYESIPRFLRESGLFTEITEARYYMPIGPWHIDPNWRRLGRAYRAVHARYANSVRSVIVEAGWSPEAVDRIIADYIEELRTMRGLVSVYYTVHARRI